MKFEQNALKVVNFNECTFISATHKIINNGQQSWNLREVLST